MKLQATIDQLWADLLSGDIRSTIKHFAHDCSISLPANKSNNVIPFVGDYAGHDGVENFFKLRAETLTPTSSSIESIHHERALFFSMLEVLARFSLLGMISQLMMFIFFNLIQWNTLISGQYMVI